MSDKPNLRLVHDDDFYQSLRRKIREWAEGKGKGHQALEYIMLTPDFLHLLAKLTLDERVPLRCKAKLGVALAYFISPIDLLPEMVLGPAGYLDDVALAAWALDDLIKTAGPELVREHWAGEDDVLLVISRTMAAANELLGAGLVRRLREFIQRQDPGPLP